MLQFSDAKGIGIWRGREEKRLLKFCYLGWPFDWSLLLERL